MPVWMSGQGFGFSFFLLFIPDLHPPYFRRFAPLFAFAQQMKVYNHIDEFHSGKNPVVTTGTFDGVHLGHQQIISQLKNTAKKCDGETVLLTFFPHPRMVLFPDYKPLLLNTPAKK